MSDLRLYARFDFEEAATLYAEGNPEPFHARIVDIGLGGVQLRSDSKLPVEQKMTLHIRQPEGELLLLSGAARYSNPGPDAQFVTGFKFLPESHQERVAIAEFVHGVFQRQWELLAS